MIYRIERLNDSKPIISSRTFAQAGIPEEAASINGPSVAAVPGWVPEDRRADPRARYYLYFAHHGGSYIRMAWAESLTGPYHLYRPRRPGSRGVLALAEIDGRPLLRFENGVEVSSHIASPNVHVDETNRRFVLYFHGSTNTSTPPPHHMTGPQKTLVATSATGLNFNLPEHGGEPGHGLRPALLGNAYFCVFAFRDYVYAFSNGGELWRAPRDRAWLPADPPTADSWERGPNPVADALAQADASASFEVRSTDPRHFAVRFVEPDRLEVFFSLRGDIEESIERIEIDLGGGEWSTWRATDYARLLSPQEPWEGALLPREISRGGGQIRVRQLRDPAVFADSDGSSYLFYCGAGEEGIGVAALQRLSRDQPRAISKAGKTRALERDIRSDR